MMEPTGAEKRILLVEDDEPLRESLAEQLHLHQEFEAVEAKTAAEALELTEAQRFDLILLDIGLPDMDGREACRLIRRAGHKTPIIMLTGADSEADTILGLDAGANDYLAKPFDAGELRARVEVGRRMVELQAQLAESVSELQTALEHVKTLRGIVPICAHCKKIRDDQGYWSQVEVYVRDHSEAEFSHGICPECIKRFYP